MQKKTIAFPAPRVSQGDLFAADLRYVLLLSALITSGTASQIGPIAIAVLIALKTSANYETGRCNLGQRLIGKQIGSSTSSVARALKILEEHSLIKVVSSGKSQRKMYQIVESIPLFKDEKPVGEMTFPFRPLSFAKMLMDARSIARTGEIPNASPIVLNLTINIIQHTGSGNVVVNESKETSTHVVEGSLTADAKAFFARMLKGEKDI